MLRKTGLGTSSTIWHLCNESSLRLAFYYQKPKGCGLGHIPRIRFHGSRRAELSLVSGRLRAGTESNSTAGCKKILIQTLTTSVVTNNSIPPPSQLTVPRRL